MKEVFVQKQKDHPAKDGILTKAVFYCLLMCTLIDAAVLVLYWHSATAPDSLAIAAMAAPWMVEFGSTAAIQIRKNVEKTEQTAKGDTTNESE